MKEIVKQLKKHISMNEKTLFAEHDEEEEEDLTARLLQLLESCFSAVDSKKYEIQTRIFKRKGPHSEEHFIGADFITILHITEGDKVLRKYFLAQSKKCNPKGKLKFDDRLREQCQKMTSITPDAFIFAYSPKGVFVKSALNEALAYKRLHTFFEDFLNCFIGDIKIGHEYCKPCWNCWEFSHLLKDKEQLAEYLNVFLINITRKGEND